MTLTGVAVSDDIQVVIIRAEQQPADRDVGRNQGIVAEYLDHALDAAAHGFVLYPLRERDPLCFLTQTDS